MGTAIAHHRIEDGEQLPRGSVCAAFAGLSAATRRRYLGVDPIGLRELADGLGKVANLTRIDDGGRDREG